METWEDVNQALGEMVRLKVRINAAEAKMNERINAAKERAEHTITPLQEKYGEIEARVEGFVLAHKQEFAKRRTKKLFYGDISSRVTEKIVVPLKDACVLALKALGLVSCIRVVEEPNKEAMKGLDDNTLTKVGAARVNEDSITIKPNLEKVEEVPA